MKKTVMKVRVALGSLILIGSVASAWDIKGMNASYKFEPLNEQVYVMHGPLGSPSVANQGFMNNPAVIVAKDALIVVDPGSTYQVGKKVLEEIKKISDKPIVAVFNSHVHGDHWLGNQAIKEAYPEVKIYANPEMIKEAKAGEGDNWAALMLKYTEGASKGTVPNYPAIAVHNGDKLVISGETFRIYSQAKAHTSTDMMIEHQGSKTLFLGDNDFNGRLGRFDDTSSIYGNIKALEQAKALHLSYFVPGHGRSGDFTAAVEPFLNYLLLLEKETKLGYENDLADFEIKKTILEKTKKYYDWQGFEEGLGKQVNKMYLEIEEKDL